MRRSLEYNALLGLVFIDKRVLISYVIGLSAARSVDGINNVSVRRDSGFEAEEREGLSGGQLMCGGIRG
jgi:hypothetical protein